MNVYQIIFITSIIVNVGLSWYIESNSSNYKFWEIFTLAIMFEAVVMLLSIIYIALGEM